MTTDLLAIIEESKRLDGLATEGPWFADTDPERADEWTLSENYVHDEHGFEAVCIAGKAFKASEDNAQFIAHARTALPALVAEVERLQRVVDQAVAFSGLVILPMREHDVPSMSLPEGIRCHRCQLRGTDEHPDLYAELKAREGR